MQPKLLPKMQPKLLPKMQPRFIVKYEGFCNSGRIFGRCTLFMLTVRCANLVRQPTQWPNLAAIPFETLSHSVDTGRLKIKSKDEAADRNKSASATTYQHTVLSPPGPHPQENQTDDELGLQDKHFELLSDTVLVQGIFHKKDFCGWSPSRCKDQDWPLRGEHSDCPQCPGCWQMPHNCCHVWLHRDQARKHLKDTSSWLGVCEKMHLLCPPSPDWSPREAAPGNQFPHAEKGRNRQKVPGINCHNGWKLVVLVWSGHEDAGFPVVGERCQPPFHLQEGDEHQQSAADFFFWSPGIGALWISAQPNCHLPHLCGYSLVLPQKSENQKTKTVLVLLVAYGQRKSPHCPGHQDIPSADRDTSVAPPHPYLPDLVPNDFFFYPWVKRDLKGNRYSTLEELEAAADDQIALIPSKDFHECICSQWPKWWAQCVNSASTYFKGVGNQWSQRKHLFWQCVDLVCVVFVWVAISDCLTQLGTVLHHLVPPWWPFLCQTVWPLVACTKAKILPELQNPSYVQNCSGCIWQTQTCIRIPWHTLGCMWATFWAALAMNFNIPVGQEKQLLYIFTMTTP